MLYFVFGQVLSFLFDLFTTTHSPDHHKDIQILLLRQQVRILQRTLRYAEQSDATADAELRAWRRRREQRGRC